MMSSSASFDLRQKLGRSRKSKSRSRSPSYEPPPPPSHPSRMVSKSRKRTEESISRHSKAAVPVVSKSMSVARPRRSRSKSPAKRRHKSGSGEKSKKKRAVSTSQKKRKDRSSSSSSSSSESDIETYKERQKRIIGLLKKLDKTDAEARSCSRRRKRKSGSGESVKSRRRNDSDSGSSPPSPPVATRKGRKMSDQVVPDTTTPFAMPLSPTEAKTVFRPKLKPKVAIAGHKECRVCFTYYQDEETAERDHLRLHQDRMFLVSLPSDAYFYDIEAAITHLIVKVGIKRPDLEEKNRQNKLITNPSNLRGFSCDICEMLDTNSMEEVNRHMKDECGVRDKAERAKHIIYFCRGCQGKFYSRPELEQHVTARLRACWPSPMTINILYDRAAADLLHPPAPAAPVRVKQEVVELHARQLQIKQERREQQLELQAARSASSNPAAVPEFNFNFGPPSETREPFNAYSFPDPPSQSHLDSTPLETPPPDDNMSKSELQRILTKVGRQVTPAPAPVPPKPVLDFSRPPDYSLPPPSTNVQNYINPSPFPSPFFPDVGAQYQQYHSPDVGHSSRQSSVEPRHRGRRSHGSQPEEPSPAFSPVRHDGPKISLPAPSAPLPSVGDLFCDREGSVAGSSRSVSRLSHRSSADSSCDILVAEHARTTASSLNCARLTCLWTDPHVDTCRRKMIQAACAEGKCRRFNGLHAEQPKCKHLNFYCNGTKLPSGEYTWYNPDTLKEVRAIPNTVTDGSHPDRACLEPAHVPMRLLHRRTNRSLVDPRLVQKVYPMAEVVPMRSFRRPGRANRGWSRDVVICTWSGLSLVTVSREANPHCQAESDDSDIEVL